MDQRKELEHHMDRVPLLLRALLVQPMERRCQTPLLAPPSLSWLPAWVLLGELEELLVSCCLGSRSVAGICISSRCPHCDTSRTVWSRPFQLPSAGLVKSEGPMHPSLIITYFSFRLVIDQP